MFHLVDPKLARDLMTFLVKLSSFARFFAPASAILIMGVAKDIGRGLVWLATLLRKPYLHIKIGNLDMKRSSLFVIVIVVSLGCGSPQRAIADVGLTEVDGVIRNVSVNVHLIVVEVAQNEKDLSSKSENSIKSVLVEPETNIRVRGKEAELKDLEAGQKVKVLLQGDTSKAASIEAW